MPFTWDERKNAANIRKHGISFERAVRVFEGPLVEEVDDREDDEEERIKAIGLIETTEVVVIYTDRSKDERRIISARRATIKEREQFWKGVAR